MARGELTYSLLLKSGQFTEGLRSAGKESQQFATRLAGVKSAQLDVRDATLKLERAQQRASRAVERYGKDSLQAAEAQVRLERAQLRVQGAQDRLNASTTRQSRITGSLSTQLRRAASAAAGAAVAYASLSTIKDAVNVTEELGVATLRLHNNFGLSIESAGQLAAVLKARNIDIKQGQQAFAVLNRQIIAAGEGSKTASRAFGLLGISTRELRGKDLIQTLGLVADGLQRAGGGAERTTAGTRLLGRGWQSLLPLLSGGNAALTEQLQLTEKYGATLGGKTVGEVKRLLAAQREQRIALLGLQVSVGRVAIPVLTKFADVSSQVAVTFRREWPKISAALRPVIPQMRRVGEAIADIAGVARTMLPGLARFVRGWAGTVGGAFTTVANIIRLRPAAAVRSMAGAIRSSLDAVVGIIQAAIGPFRKAGSRLGSAIVNGIRSAIGSGLGIGKSIANAVIGLLNDAIPNNIGPVDLPANPIPRLARGGRISGGAAGRDSVLALLMPGEHVLTAKEVQAAGGHSAIFRMRRALGGGGQARGMAYAAGGVVTGDTDYGGELGRRLRAMARATGVNIFVQSGGRTLAEQRALVRAKGVWSPSNPTGAAPANPNAPHIRGVAADITPGRSRFGAIASRFGLAFPISAEPWHVTLSGDFRGGGRRAPRRGGSGGGGGGGGYPKPPYRERYDIRGLVALALWAGFRGENAAIAAAVAMGESGGITKNTSTAGNSPPSRDRGLWQINSYWNSNISDARAYDPHEAAKAAYSIWKSRGWKDWVVYTRGRHQQFMPAARKALKELQDTRRSTRTPSSQNRTKLPSAAQLKRQAGVRRDVNRSRLERLLEGRYQVALTTPGTEDDMVAARQGLAFGQGRVDLYGRLAARDPIRFGGKLADALDYRNSWQSRIGELSPSGGGSGEDPAAVLKQIRDALDEQNARARALASASDGALAVAVTNVVTGQIGGRVGLGFQRPSVAGYARY